MMNIIQATALVVGQFAFIKFVYPLLNIFYHFTLGRWLFSKRGQLKQAGEWAIVTGSTDGIGKEFARQLAAEGLNIVLISRNNEKLESVSEEIKQSYNVKVKILQADFSKADVYGHISSELEALSSIACLVNNVGLMNKHFEEFAYESSLSADRIRELVNVNLLSTLCMTRLVLAKMIEQRSKSFIINISSAAANLCLPYHNIYAALKAGVKHFTECLSAEVNQTSILVQGYCPMFVATNIAPDLEKGFFVPDVKTFVNSALNMLGVEQHTTGYFRHSFQMYLFSFAPRPLMIQSIRKDFLEFSKKKF